MDNEYQGYSNNNNLQLQIDHDETGSITLTAGCFGYHTILAVSPPPPVETKDVLVIAARGFGIRFLDYDLPLPDPSCQK